MTLADKLAEAEAQYAQVLELHQRAVAALNEAAAQVWKAEGRVVVLRELAKEQA